MNSTNWLGGFFPMTESGYVINPTSLGLMFWAVESFAQYYPQKPVQMKKILNLYVQPLDKKQQLTTLLEEVTPWILSESKRLTS